MTAIEYFPIFFQQAYTFPVETAFAAEKEQCLPEIIKNRTVPLLKVGRLNSACRYF